ncbi:hypothetical protein OQA88_1095 [Cercophora sp. LCS_1]
MVLTIHHLHVSQSERVVWLCEELAIPYELKTYTRAPLLAPPEYKALHPAGTSPVIQDSDGDLTLAESSACIEYIARKVGGGRLFLEPDNPAYADFLYWFHWANGTMQPTLARTMVLKAAGLDVDHPLSTLTDDRIARSLGMLEKRLRDNEWLAGSQFTAADIMAVFSLTTFRYYTSFSLKGYDGILGYLERVGMRGAYRRAMEKCDPHMALALGAEPPKV